MLKTCETKWWEVNMSAVIRDLLVMVLHSYREDTGKTWWGGVESPDPDSILEEVMGWCGVLWSRFYIGGGDGVGWCPWSRFYIEGSDGVEFLIRVLGWRKRWGGMTSPDTGSMLEEVMGWGDIPWHRFYTRGGDGVGWGGVPWHRLYTGEGEAFIPMEMLLILMQDAQFC